MPRRLKVRIPASCKGPIVLAVLVVARGANPWPIVAFAVVWLLQDSVGAALRRLSSVEVAGFKGLIAPPDPPTADRGRANDS